MAAPIAGMTCLRNVGPFVLEASARLAGNPASGSRFALEPQARERCLIEAPGMAGGPTKLFKGLGFYAGR